MTIQSYSDTNNGWLTVVRHVTVTSLSKAVTHHTTFTLHQCLHCRLLSAAQQPLGCNSIWVFEIKLRNSLFSPTRCILLLKSTKPFLHTLNFARAHTQTHLLSGWPAGWLCLCVCWCVPVWVWSRPVCARDTGCEVTAPTCHLFANLIYILIYRE